MTNNKYNPYHELNLPNFAEINAIKSSFKKLAKKHHPDSNTAPNPEKFIAIKKAYDFLMDPNKKLLLDFELRQKETKHQSSNTSEKQRSSRKRTQRKTKPVLEEDEFDWQEIVVGAALIFGAGYLYGRYKNKRTI